MKTLSLIPVLMLCACSSVSTPLSQPHKIDQAIPKFQHEETLYAHADKTKWHNFIAKETTLETVNAKINSITYKAELPGHSYWKSPTELVHDGSGNCKDYALAKFHALKELGYDEHRLKITIVKDTAWRDHAILLVDDSLMLDNENEKIVKREDSDYHFIFAVNNFGVYQYE